MEIDRVTIKVMADYESFPLWRNNTDGQFNIDPASLPIPPDLVQDLLAWADAFDRTLNRSDPASSRFPDATTETAFYAEGERLARRLATEVGSQYCVEYFDGSTGHTKLIT